MRGMQDYVKGMYCALALTHLTLVPHIYTSVNRISVGSDNGLSPVRRQAIVNWTLRNKLQWNFDKNTKLFIQENAFENIVCDMAAILSRERWAILPCCRQHQIRMMPSFREFYLFPDVPVVSKSLFPYRSWHHPGSDFWHREKKSYKVTYRKLNVKQSRHAAIRSSHNITKRINSLGVGRCRCSNKLTHWGRDQIDAISQTTFSSAFSWMKMFQLRLKFPTEVCFQGSN